MLWEAEARERLERQAASQLKQLEEVRVGPIIEFCGKW